MRDAAGPDVVWQQLSPGDVVTLASGHRVRALAANHDPDTGPPLLYDISAESTGSGGVLVAWDTAAPLPPDAARPASGAGPHGPYDAVLLECTAGNEAPADGHHDLAGFARTVTALRRDGAIAPTTRVVAVHLGHANPPGPELAARLAQLGAEAVSDGTELRLGPAGTGPSAAPGPSRVLVTGGTRSGKSAEAERRVTGRDVTYVATSLPRPGDADWAARVAIHRSRRPADWRTVETLDVAGLLRTALPSDTLLVDCMSLWLAARMDSADLAAEVDDLIAAWRETDATVVLVTSEVGSAVHAPTREGRAYADALGSLNGRLAAESDETWLVVAGCPLRLR
jgi:adenosylcobinamide kinase/adenosylcobinamide-phosphate guanylyltransferase